MQMAEPGPKGIDAKKRYLESDWMQKGWLQKIKFSSSHIQVP